MVKRSTKTLTEQCEKVTIRFTKSQAERIAAECELNGMKPSVYLRLASMSFTNSKFLDVFSLVSQVAEEQVRFRRDFNEAVYREGES
ncbi:hypothetical protein [Bythopirellula goksoeyrii]|uniref:Uncharacterized protein n=1 Tax=Bythopirellula goksoeyrii TaxID=1400387 RepID=A0A5B9QAA2_9BACT|nr:hypothetical protein [Bythopirellula goksoeyrii]QEG35907.1 hypothetical protein Pr1d_32140 [Bythopirellula goksoeyrii]